jgi:Uma2 family endonuclease
MAVETLPKQEKQTGQTVPDYLIYEVVKGNPIYYKGYKDVLNKTKTFEEITMESTLQAWLKTYLANMLINALFNKNFVVVAGELGLNMQNKTKRGADLSVFKKENFVLSTGFSNLAPEIILEIDVQADTENTTEMDYVLEKIKDYLDFGVKKVFWIFTKNRKVMVATEQEPWLTYSWNADLEILEGVKINLLEMVEQQEKK